MTMPRMVSKLINRDAAKIEKKRVLSNTVCNKRMKHTAFAQC
jgi:hypothetical protein